MGLVAGELERRGIATVALQLLRLVTEKVRPPRALLLPFPHGYPMQRPNDPTAQRRVLRRALEVLDQAEGPPPLLAEWPD